jgi:outer membrane protein TolC
MKFVTFFINCKSTSQSWVSAIPVFFLALAWSLNAAVWAASETVPPQNTASQTSLADLVNRAIKANPKIDQARNMWRAAIEKYGVVTGLPDPQLMVSYFPDPIETRLGPQDWNVSLSFTIPYPGKLARKGSVARTDARIAQLKLDKTIRDVVVAVRESVHELTYIRKAQQVADANAKLLDHLRKVSETAHAQDRAAFIDVIRAQSQTGQIRYDKLLLSGLEQAEVARLNALLDRPPDTPIAPLAPETLQPIVYTLNQIYTLAETHQDEIRITNAQLDSAMAREDLARHTNRPNFKVGFFYAGIGEPDVRTPPPDAGEDALGVQLGVSIPFWLNKNKGRVAGAKAKVRAAQAAHKVRINQTRADIQRLFFRLTTAEQTLALYRDELLPQSAQTITLAETWFREGQSSFSNFVEAQAVWYNFNLALARAQADYGKFLARLEKIVGRSLTHKPAVKEAS